MLGQFVLLVLWVTFSRSATVCTFEEEKPEAVLTVSCAKGSVLTEIPLAFFGPANVTHCPNPKRDSNDENADVEHCFGLEECSVNASAPTQTGRVLVVSAVCTEVHPLHVVVETIGNSTGNCTERFPCTLGEAMKMVIPWFDLLIFQLHPHLWNKVILAPGTHLIAEQKVLTHYYLEWKAQIPGSYVRVLVRFLETEVQDTTSQLSCEMSGTAKKKNFFCLRASALLAGKERVWLAF